MKVRLVPWILVILLSVFVYGLTWHAENREKPDPSYDFYLPSIVKVQINSESTNHGVYGQYNNILEGTRVVKEALAEAGNSWRLNFLVNSPRPATLYIDDEPIDIFLVPGDSTLVIQVDINETDYQIDSLQFEGEIADICEYLQNKYERFRQTQIRSTRNLVDATDLRIFSSKLDSMAAKELAFLAEQEVFSTLPEWFVDFEKTDILYQKAYLKRSSAYNRDLPESYYDRIPFNNDAAMFSYYYYLYLTAYINEVGELPPNGPAITDPNYAPYHQKQMALADSLLEGGAHDVFMTRSIFNILQKEQLDLAASLLDEYEGRFSSKKYARFLKMQLKKRKENELS